jgi:hypothetical protein
MNHLNRLAQLVGINAVPFFGVVWSDWSDATAIAFYWCETALVVAFVSFRILLHRHLTRRRGHWVEMKVSTNGGPFRTRATTFNASFLMASIAFGAGNLIFLFVMLVLFGDRTGGGAIDVDALRVGVLTALGIVAAGFVLDLPGLGARPFGFVRAASEGALARVFVLYAALFAGTVAAVLADRPGVLFSVFFGLRLLTDVTSYFRHAPPLPPPRWVGRVSEGWRAHWEAHWKDEVARHAEDEEPYEGIPSRSAASGLQLAGSAGARK